jgi:catechol 2,3-dioxygenase-like lactoylglutathione lyase family enzyme
MSWSKLVIMKKILLSFVTILFLLPACRTNTQKFKHMEVDPYSYELGVVGGFAELIGSGVKKLALSAPLSSEEMDIFAIHATDIASRHGVSVYREADLLVSDLFPADVALDREVLILYKGTTLEAYKSLKSDKKALEKEGAYDVQARIRIARRFGRMLSYSPREINRLLASNSSFRTMDDFGIQASNLFLYYKDLEKALNFYSKTLGMEVVADYGMAYILRMGADSYLILVDALKGMHTAQEPKTVALALLTESLDAWYSYLKSQGVPIKYEYQPKEGSAHDGFVAVDPEGYLLEFERFNQHPENEKFIPVLQKNMRNYKQSGRESKLPGRLDIHSTITWLYHKDLLAMQNFYQDVLGLEMVADQGWTKIFRVSTTGFLAIVDEKRGMHSFTEKKAVNVGFVLDNLEGWFDYASNNSVFELYEEELGIGPLTRYKAFVGFCPEGYYLEFDRFYPHEDNHTLLNYLNN